MKFREWLDGVQKLKVEISEVEESLYADGHSITVSIRDKAEAAVDGQKSDVRYLRTYFTHHKDDFEAMLEALTDRCKALAETTELAQNIAAYDAIPAAVLNRLKGEDTGDDLVRRSVENKFRELMAVAKKIDSIFEELTFDFPSFGDYGMSLVKRPLSLQWGHLYTTENYLSGKASLEEMLMFLGNFDVIKARLEEFVAVAESLKKIGR